MNNLILMLNAKISALVSEEQGQDLVEYALLVALVSLAAVASLQGLATAIGSIFTAISTSLTNA